MQHTYVTTAALTCLICLSFSVEQVEARTTTDNQGWRTTRTSDRCATYKNASDLYQTKIFAIGGDSTKTIAVLKLNASKYPGVAKHNGKKITQHVIVSRGQRETGRADIQTHVIVDGQTLLLAFDTAANALFAKGTSVQIPFEGDAFQNISAHYGDFAIGLKDYRHCEAIRTGTAASSKQSKDTPLDELPPFERAKKVCEQELRETGGVFEADNPYVLFGRQYSNACAAARDAALRHVEGRL